MKKSLAFSRITLSLVLLCLLICGCTTTADPLSSALPDQSDLQSADGAENNGDITNATSKKPASPSSEKPSSNVTSKNSSNYDADDDFYGEESENTTSRKPNTPGEPFSIAIIPDT